MVEESATIDDIARSGSLSHRADPEACLLAPSLFLLLSASYLCRFSLLKKSPNFTSLSCLTAILLESKY